MSVTYYGSGTMMHKFPQTSTYYTPLAFSHPDLPSTVIKKIQTEPEPPKMIRTARPKPQELLTTVTNDNPPQIITK